MLFENIIFYVLENKKQFLITKYVFLIFGSREQKTVLESSCQTSLRLFSKHIF